jgi:hypothetical protein
MRIFEGNTSSYSSKVNFVDDNDVFVGFDTDQCCCEDAGWFITSKITPYDYKGVPETTKDVEDYTFDKEFCEDVPSSHLDAGSMVAFRLVAKGKVDLYLHIYNAHNGYYSHGLTVKHGEEVIKDDYL